MAKSKHQFHAWVIWILSASYMFYKYVIEVSPSVMTQSLMGTFHLDGSALGNLAASYYYAYLLMQIPVGLLIDRYGPRKMTTGAILLCGIGTLIFSQADVVLAAGIGRFIVGIGAAFAAVNCMKLTANWFPHNRFAFMTGLMMTVGMLGAWGGISPLSQFVSFMGWRSALFQIGVIGIFLAILFMLIVRDNPKKVAEKKERSFSPLVALLRIIKKPQCWYISIYSGLAFAPVTAFGGLWGVTFIEEAYQISKANAGHITSLIFLGFALGAPLAGILSDKIGKRKPLMFWGVLFATILLSAVIYVPFLPLTILALFMFLLGVMLSPFLICFTVIRELTSKMVAATAIGFMNALDALFGAIADPVTGLILDIVWDGKIKNGAHTFSVHDFQIGLGILPIFLLASLVFLFFTEETNCKEQHSADFLA